MGANDLKIFAISNSVLKPDFYSTSFLVTGYQNQLPEISQDSIQFEEDKDEFLWMVIPIIGVIIAIVVYLRKRSK
jgi:peptide/nickel transport system substrate-binding protein